MAPLGLLVLFVALPSGRIAEQRSAPVVLKPRIRYAAPNHRGLPLPAHAMYLKVERGDTLETLFRAAGLAQQEAARLARDFGSFVDLRRIRDGELVRFYRSDSEGIQQIDLHVTGWGEVRATRNPAGQFEVQAIRHPERRVEVVVSAPVERSLYEAIEAAGEKPQLAPQIVETFQWDVDFFRLRRGDWFSLIVERRYVGNDQVGYGPIRAAKFHFQGETYEAFRFELPDGTAGYYTRGGTPVRKQFLKAPLKFTRITSGFSHRRFHPLLRRFRPHYGVDYGAPIGAPVVSTADGVVIFAGYDQGEGKYIRIRHNSRIETSYLHLARFAKGIRKGIRVTQGDIIGYVGMTGLTTGPHLDYRVTDNGRPLNPLALRSITPDPLNGISLRRFRLSVGRYLPKLETEETLLAKSGESAPPALF